MEKFRPDDRDKRSRTVAKAGKSLPERQFFYLFWVEDLSKTYYTFYKVYFMTRPNTNHRVMGVQ